MDLGNRYLFHYEKLPLVCFGAFKDMKQKGKLCDVTIKFGNHSISAHRLVLAAAIPHFADMFTDPESGCDLKEIYMSEIDPYALESLIDFAYNCEVEITEDNVQTLLSASCALNVGEVREACCDFLRKLLNPQNVLLTREVATKFSCSHLVERCDAYICENFDEVVQTEEFLNVPSSLVTELLVRDDLKTSSEENVFEAVMRWVKQSLDERKNELPEVLSKVRLALLSLEYIMDHIQTEEHVLASMPCRDLLDKVKFYHLLPHRRTELSSLMTRIRPTPGNKSGNAVAGIYAVSKLAHLNVQCFDPEREQWGTVKTTTLKIYGCVSAVDDKLYFVGSDFLRTHIPQNPEWVLKSESFIGRIGTGTAVLDNKLYVCGGGDKFFSNKVEYFDLENGNSMLKTPMSVSRNLLGVVALEKHIYAIGGQNAKVLNFVERYDPITSRWSTVSPMLTRRYGMGCTTLGGKIYVCGGKSSLNDKTCLSSAEVYDPLINQWKSISSMKTARHMCSLLAYCEKLYVIGGRDDREVCLNSVEIYDSWNDKWKFGPSMEPFLMQEAQSVIVQSKSN